MQRKIIHIDMDAFFVSVEIRDNPALAGLPVAVGGKSNRRGVISTCNYIAREFGVRSAMSTAIALHKCPNLVLLPGRMEVYQQVSSQIREIMHRYTDLIEPLSLDEAYLDVTDCDLFHGSATLIAQDIRQAIYKELNLTASAGIAPIKYLAKVASDLNKPNGQYVIPPQDVASFIEAMPLTKIPGVGKVTAEKLHRYNLKLGKDVRHSSEEDLIQAFGKFGGILWKRCQGIDDRAVEISRIRKSVGVERTFSEDIHSEEELHLLMKDRLIPELKRRAEKHLASRSISKLGVKVKFKDFHQTTKEFKHTYFDDEIFDELLSEAMTRGEGKAVRLLGVHIGLEEKKADTARQLELTL